MNAQTNVLDQNNSALPTISAIAISTPKIYDKITQTIG
ncbi:MAG: hypothetical protein ACI9UT_000044 [Flavobacteriales bacterium]|jgi:hypothetical protein